MRTEILNELEAEYALRRAENEKTEALRRDEVRTYPEIEELLLKREALIHGTIRGILNGTADGDGLAERMREMNGRIRQALSRRGFPEDYLEPVYQCAICRDKGYVEQPLKKTCRCFLEAYQRKLRASIGILSENRETFETFDESLLPDETLPGDSFSQRDYALLARDRCSNWADAYPEAAPKNILLSGDSGLGKTFLMHAIAARLIERGYPVLIISAFQLIQIARKSFFEGDDGMDELIKTPVLMIDDLGSEPLMKNITIEQLFHLIDERQQKGLSTIISSNLSMEDLQERYTERITSRLSDPRKCMRLMLAGRDLRKTNR